MRSMITSRLPLLLLAFFAGAVAHAQTAITSITTTTTDSRNSSTNGTTFDNTTIALNTFTDSSGATYTYTSSGVAAYVRRDTNAGNSNQTSAWYAQDPSNSSRMVASYATTESSLLLGNNLARGADNLFANGTGAQDGNIERVDFILKTTGVTATSSMSFAVFDRGEVGVHDGFKIALITGFNASTGQVTAYAGKLLSVTSANYGSTNVASDFDYNLFRSNSGDDLSSWTDNTETGTQGIGGVVFSLADFGLAPGTTIYGYSLMAADVTNGGSMSNLVNWNNTNYYPTNTSDATGPTGLDPAAVNGVLFTKSPVPEPATYGAWFIGAALGFFLLRRRRPAALAAGA